MITRTFLREQVDVLEEMIAPDVEIKEGAVVKQKPAEVVALGKDMLSKLLTKRKKI